jgi:hypothetical protein
MKYYLLLALLVSVFILHSNASELVRKAFGDGPCDYLGEGFEKHQGLCYKKCKDGYKGVGPVCWKRKGLGSYGRGEGKLPMPCEMSRAGADGNCYKPGRK